MFIFMHAVIVGLCAGRRTRDILSASAPCCSDSRRSMADGGGGGDEANGGGGNFGSTSHSFIMSNRFTVPEGRSGEYF